MGGVCLFLNVSAFLGVSSFIFPPVEGVLLSVFF